MNNQQVTALINNLIGEFNIMIWLYIKILWGNLVNNISKTKQNKCEVNLENKLTRKHCMSIIKVIKKNKVKLIIYKP